MQSKSDGFLWTESGQAGLVLLFLTSIHVVLIQLPTVKLQRVRAFKMKMISLAGIGKCHDSHWCDQ